ncbi:hypothetical protein RDWZM_006655 [Blomia tropicalis]|uniref:EB domain-containing protein n=1 Tax=Blomia tropicalis TaxID=40697 RepID=A0A9Q0M8Y3_BLOTA|nr:hypothetical protein BLOT_008331 [Blomia tropicalis]KAJ6220843.1 hypothetical protein RDWZM_006655 [Blomia tropicalis]
MMPGNKHKINMLATRQQYQHQFVLLVTFSIPCLVIGQTHLDSYEWRQCKSNESCYIDADDGNESHHWLCVDLHCQCEPNYRLIRTNNNQSSKFSCQLFQCFNDEDCQQYDHHRVCIVANGTCQCRSTLVEDTTNGRRCIPLYSKIPEYEKRSRKYLNKNRISYRKNIEHNEGQSVPIIQYAMFAAFFLGQIILLASYVASRRQKMIHKLVQRQFSDQKPITTEIIA